MSSQLEKTDLSRTIAMLQAAGRHGLTELDTDGSNGNGRAIDSGPPFRRLAARICDARKLHYTIKTHRDGPGGMARYVLIPDTQAQLDVSGTPERDDGLRLATPEEEELAERARLLLEDPS